MSWSYRKRIKIIPGVHLNISKNGISTNIGVRGANITFRKSGSHLNTSIPLLGINSSQKLSGSNTYPNRDSYNETVEFTDNIFSADIHEITSQNMQGIKEAIILAHTQKKGFKKRFIENTNKFKLFKNKIESELFPDLWIS